jgi:hypothetical protein
MRHLLVASQTMIIRGLWALAPKRRKAKLRWVVLGALLAVLGALAMDGAVREYAVSHVRPLRSLVATSTPATPAVAAAPTAMVIGESSKDTQSTQSTPAMTPPRSDETKEANVSWPSPRPAALPTAARVVDPTPDPRSPSKVKATRGRTGPASGASLRQRAASDSNGG